MVSALTPYGERLSVIRHFISCTVSSPIEKEKVDDNHFLQLYRISIDLNIDIAVLSHIAIALELVNDGAVAAQVIAINLADNGAVGSDPAAVYLADYSAVAADIAAVIVTDKQASGFEIPAINGSNYGAVFPDIVLRSCRW